MVQQRKSTDSRVNSRVRLNKYLADCGVASRRKADELIEEGAITVNGKKVFELGVKVDPEKDKILFRGKAVAAPTQFVYYAFYKPKNVVTTTSDPYGRPTVIDYFLKLKLRLFPVGRLDWDAEGLLLVTNDGDFAQEVIHPRKEVIKIYQAKLDGVPTMAKLDKLKRGVSIEGGGRVSAVSARSIKSTDKKAWVEIAIKEGKNHQIKKMFAKIGYDVLKLKRISIGGLKLSGLKPGEFKELKSTDLMKIFNIKEVKK